LERGEMDAPNVFITAELFIYLLFFRAFEVFLLVMGSKSTTIGPGKFIYFLVHLFDSRKKEDFFNVWIY
jgi:hypothetical protein